MSRIPPGPPPGGPPGVNGVPPGPPAGGPSVPFVRPGMPLPSFPPPLPPGWSEHRAPDGVTPYYYNATTKQSTYVRPSLAAPPAAADAAPKKQKKEKPKQKVPIPDTEWTRVTTNEGNVFYFHKPTKRSEWTVPDEIAEAVAALEAREEAEKKAKIEEERQERLKAQERARAEVAEERKRKAEEAAERKRKATEAAGTAASAPKKAKVEKKEDGEEGKEEDGVGPQGEEDEEAWMKAVAAEFAEADSKAAADALQEEADAKKAEEEAAKAVFAAKANVKVSAEEGKALFKALLYEKNISPFAPWDQALPQFINDPRYVLLGSEKERRDAYEDYCREAGRQKRLNKPAPAVEKKKPDAQAEFRALMREEVTSTRTRFEDFKRKFKKDRRFYSFGRDDREREKAFKVHLRELGERKRADAARAEADFLELLGEADVQPGAQWSEVKKGIFSDARYDAVGSSSLRAELFGKFLKELEDKAAEGPEESAAEKKIRERKERQAASLRERENAVREQQAKIGEDVDKSRHGAGREEAERLFGSLLVDVVRDHETTWQQAVPILQQDPRFSHPSLSNGHRSHLFNTHVARLAASKADALAELFAVASPRLDTTYDEVYAAIADDPLVSRLNLSPDALRQRYDAWARTREQTARREFEELLAENSFVDFWGKMRNKVVDEGAKKIAAGAEDEDDEDEEDEEGNKRKRDIVGMAKNVDLAEIKSVLRRDKRYRQFDHVAEQREQWLREYLENLEGSKGTETVHKVGY